MPVDKPIDFRWVELQEDYKKRDNKSSGIRDFIWVRLVLERYLLKYKKNMQYAQYLKMGLPIAPGVIEGACRYLVKDRMDRTGARRSLNGAEAVLRLRARRTRADFDAYWRFHEQQEYRRNHVAL